MAPRQSQLGTLKLAGERAVGKQIFLLGNGSLDLLQISHTSRGVPGLPSEFFADFFYPPKGVYSSVESCVGGKRTRLFSVALFFFSLSLFLIAFPNRSTEGAGSSGGDAGAPSGFSYFFPIPDSLKKGGKSLGRTGRSSPTSLAGAGRGTNAPFLGVGDQPPVDPERAECQVWVAKGNTPVLACRGCKIFF